ncbi:Membrane protein, HPP family [Thioalkalivibrio nitratireducens DSM 14787]|uniref:Membrane protein, HPP family n=1 Tax=Thioalkalivibrio nitratireducens (strain DSM 14787 / UNIQEM 213 / ALEN2) TaxID=1255043 RepID=L0DWP5_THIND|nr:HPP family protein [Thioalkalivibrio nitratireducens]AGA33422.1 Membrane protein, HPP family [Thioalkalivibrio nitratireducens DSM 14787]
MNYLRKMLGTTRGNLPRVSNTEVFWSWCGAFIGIAVVGLLHQQFFEGTAYLLLISSFGASAVLLFGAPRSPLAQPRNLVGGHLLSALIGVAAFKLLGGQIWLAEAGAVATAIAAMHLTRTLHPPGGATALLAVMGGEQVHSLGFLFVLLPVAAGALILLAVAVLFNNLPKTRRYPEVWL